MSKLGKKINLIKKDDLEWLDICVNLSHNKPLPNQRIIQLVKLLARQAAEEDYARVTIQSQSRKT